VKYAVVNITQDFKSGVKCQRSKSLGRLWWIDLR